jgi:hypothetical protein
MTQNSAEMIEICKELFDVQNKTGMGWGRMTKSLVNNARANMGDLGIVRKVQTRTIDGESIV